MSKESTPHSSRLRKIITAAPLLVLSSITLGSCTFDVKVNANTSIAGNPSNLTLESGVLTGSIAINGETVTIVPYTVTPKPTEIPTSTLTTIPDTATPTVTPFPTTETPSVISTATTKPTEVPTVSPTPDAAKKAEQLLKEAPQIPGLKTEVQNGQVTYVAQKGNQWNFKEGEVVGEVVEFNKATIAPVADISSAKIETAKGVSLDQAIIKTIYLEANTSENLAQGKIQVPFPIRYQRGMNIFESSTGSSTFLGVSFNPSESAIGAEVLCTFPVPTDAFRSANLNGTKLSINPDSTYVPQHIAGWGLSVYLSDEFETVLRNDDHAVVEFGTRLAKITSAAKITSVPQAKDYNIAFLGATLNAKDNRNFGFGQILNINGLPIFMK